MAKTTTKVKNKSRKVGRNTFTCAAYAKSNRREKNKVKKLTKLLVTHPNDKCIGSAIDRATAKIKGY